MTPKNYTHILVDNTDLSIALCKGLKVAQKEAVEWIRSYRVGVEDITIYEVKKVLKPTLCFKEEE